MQANLNSAQSDMTWVIFVMITALSWGVYGVFMHNGIMSMCGDPVHARFKAFLFVGLAYFLTAIIAPLVFLWLNGASWDMTPKGMGWSLIAGLVGAIGAFGVLLAFGAGGKPVVVMSIIFAGAPIVNAAVAMAMHWSSFSLGSIRWQFFLGILLAATGGFLVSLYKPELANKHAPSSMNIIQDKENYGPAGNSKS